MKFLKPWTDEDNQMSSESALDHGDTSDICPKCKSAMNPCSLAEDSVSNDAFFCRTCKVTMPKQDA